MTEYIQREKKKIEESLEATGFAKSHVYHLFTDEEIVLFGEGQEYYKDFLATTAIQERLLRLEEGNPIMDRPKVFEITHHDYLGTPLTFDSGPFFQMYGSEVFFDIAESYLGDDLRMRLLSTWAHGHYGGAQRQRSQRWHRDQADIRNLNVWIYYSNVNSESGPLQYVINSRHGDTHDSLWPNYDPEADEWPTHGYLSPEAQQQIPPESIVEATGDCGTIIFADTNGFHRGGFVEAQGQIRLKTQCSYLRADAWHIRKGSLGTFNNEPEKGNFCDTNHPLYGILSLRAQKALK